MSNETTPEPLEPELSKSSKFWSAFLLISLIVLPLYFLIGLWPDRMPGEGDHLQRYSFRLFCVQLLDPAKLTAAGNSTTDSVKRVAADSAKQAATKKQKATSAADSTKNESDTGKKAGDTGKKPSGGRAVTDTTPKSTEPFDPCRSAACCCTISLNNLLLILVALAAFLGNMIYIANSYAAFVGSGKFKRSWNLWYFVKPFTAAALALAIYFAFRAGFFTYSNDAGNINIYGVMALAMLTGLFTKTATLKLQEIFDATFKPKGDNLSDPLVTTPKISDIDPVKVAKVKTTYTLKGTNLGKVKLAITMNAEPVTVTDTKPGAITFDYTPSADQQNAKAFTVLVVDEAKHTVFTKDLAPA